MENSTNSKQNKLENLVLDVNEYQMHNSINLSEKEIVALIDFFYNATDDFDEIGPTIKSTVEKLEKAYEAILRWKDGAKAWLE